MNKIESADGKIEEWLYYKGYITTARALSKNVSYSKGTPACLKVFFTEIIYNTNLQYLQQQIEKMTQVKCKMHNRRVSKDEPRGVSFKYWLYELGYIEQKTKYNKSESPNCLTKALEEIFFIKLKNNDIEGILDEIEYYRKLSEFLDSSAASPSKNGARLLNNPSQLNLILSKKDQSMLLYPMSRKNTTIVSTI